MAKEIPIWPDVLVEAHHDGGFLVKSRRSDGSEPYIDRFTTAVQKPEMTAADAEKQFRSEREHDGWKA